MDLYVRLATSDADTLIELQHWLAHDERFPAPGRQPQPPADGSLGATTDVSRGRDTDGDGESRAPVGEARSRKR